MDCRCPRCWCCICGADLARFPEPPGVEHVCPPPPVEKLGIVQTDDGGVALSDGTPFGPLYPLADVIAEHVFTQDEIDAAED